MSTKLVLRCLLWMGTAVVLSSAANFSHAQVINPGLLITELYYDPPGEESEREWFEIANVGTAVLDLSDFKLGDEEQSGGGEGMRRFPEGTQLAPEQALVVAQTAVGFRALFGTNPDFELTDSDPDIPDMRNYLLWATGDIALANDGDEVVLLNEGNLIIDSVNYGDRDTFFVPAVTAVFQAQSIERNPANCDTPAPCNSTTLAAPHSTPLSWKRCPLSAPFRARARWPQPLTKT